jgi:hypothetical protein
MQSLTNTSDSEHLMDRKSPQRGPQDCFQSLVPNYALLFFDHLHSEYLTLRSHITDQELVHLLDGIHKKRLDCQLTWSDIYTFDLALIEERPLENLIRKAYDARAKYRSIAGQKEFDEYTASKPPDLTAILIAPNTPDSDSTNSSVPAASPPAAQPGPDKPSQSSDIVQRVLRADIRYLLSKFYLYYAMLPVRERLREELTTRAVAMTKWILVLIVALIVASFGGVLVLERFSRYGDLTGAFGLTVGSVAFAGIVGGCVSMLQRIQSAPSEGDALFNLASLTNGWRGLSLSPLYGGIFASLLFILFAGGILQGSIFPKIETATNSPVVAVPASTTPTAASSAAAPANSPATVAVPTPTPLTDTQKIGILQIKDFLKETGPKDGVSFALLIIWSFIAGFAERLVPDTLNRLVAKNEAIQGTNT